MAKSTRRDSLRILAFLGVAAFVMARPWQHLSGPGLAFTSLVDVPPFRSLLGGGDVSGSPLGVALVGIDDPNEPSRRDLDLESRLRARLCQTLLAGWTHDGPVPVTYFTDIRCPICEPVERDLARLIGRTSGSIQLTTREFPIFGEVSVSAARAILAAGQFGAAEEMRTMLRRRGGRVLSGDLGQVAESAGSTAPEIIAAMDGDEVTGRLTEDMAMAAVLSLPGTPALVIGRTVVVGQRDLATMEAIVEAERQEGPPPCVIV
ncbi:MAG: DsbA family protein [Pseudomonadota bacterium]